MIGEIGILDDAFISSMKMSLFSYLNIENPIISALVTTSLFTFIGYLIKIMSDPTMFSSNKDGFTFSESFKNTFYKRNQIVLEGKQCYGGNSYFSGPSSNSIFSDQFRSVWNIIIESVCSNKSITEIKEIDSTEKNNSWDYDTCDQKNTKNNIFIVSQSKSFLFNKELNIYAYTTRSTQESNNEKSEKSTTTQIIEIVLYSYSTSLYDMKEYIIKIKEDYLKKLEISRNTHKFIYTLMKTKHEDNRLECWDEDVFTTTRSFNNMFFDGKDKIMDQINFFVNNRDWYCEKGIPYTLGVGLYGPPGTGKTSFIKALANYTGRHIISLSLKTIKTRRQLIEFFFEDRYNNNNKKHSIGFSNKIIVIEDIDAQGDIVLERKKKTQTETNANAINSIIKTIIDSNSDVENAIPTVANDSSTVVSDVKASTAFLKQPDEDLITLDDILGLWDGIKETDGRILVISSNHYEKLDPALTRPGRIDIPLEMKNASKNVIRDMYAHLYNETIDENDLKKIRDKYHSPASLINIFTTYKNNPELFIKTLCKIQRDTPTTKTNKNVVIRDSKTSNNAKKNNKLSINAESIDEIISNELVNEL